MNGERKSRCVHGDDMKREQFQLIKKYSKEQMDKLGLYGWPHVKRVLHLCVQMAHISREKKADSDVFKASALLHDIAKHLHKENTAFDHGDVGAKLAEAFLRKCDFSRGKIEAICHAIRAHTHFEEPTSIEAKILHDADFLDKLGAVGIATVFVKACLTNVTIEEVLENFALENEQQSFVIKHIGWMKNPHLYTKMGQNIAEKRNKIVSAFFGELKKEVELKDL